MSFPGSTSGKEPSCQYRRHKRQGFSPCVGKIPWRKAQQPTPVFLLGESHGKRHLEGFSPWGHKGSDTTGWLSWNWQPDTVCIPYICAYTRASEDRLFIQKVVSGLSDVAVYLQVSKLSWIERKMAATLFGSIPSSTVQEALQNFLKVCFAYPLFQCQSGSCLHQAHLQLPSRKSFSCPCVDL